MRLLIKHLEIALSHVLHVFYQYSLPQNFYIPTRVLRNIEVCACSYKNQKKLVFAINYIPVVVAMIKF